jgi:hypothetical protein
MTERREPKTAEEMQAMRKGRNVALLLAIAGLAVLFFVLTIVRIGGAG